MTRPRLAPERSRPVHGSAPSGRARITYRAATAGVPEAHGTDDFTFSGKKAQQRLQAMVRAFPVRRGAQVTATTGTFSAIGQPQPIIAPQDAMSCREMVRLTSPHH